MPDKSTKQRVLFALVFSPVVLLPLWFLGWWVYNAAHVEQRYSEGQVFATGLRAVETEFREYFHGRSDYKPLTLEDLKAAGVLKEETSAFITRHAGKYVPFTPATPAETVVLTIREDWFTSWDFTKDELTRPPVSQRQR